MWLLNLSNLPWTLEDQVFSWCKSPEISIFTLAEGLVLLVWISRPDTCVFCIYCDLKKKKILL